MTPITFTNNLSDVLAFTGVIKLKVDDIPENGEVVVLEERVDGTYEIPGDWAVLRYPTRSRLMELLGNYKIRRSHTGIAVGTTE